jgi:hypothetical protein
VQVALVWAGSGEGSDHFGSYVQSLSLHFCKMVFPGLETMTSWSQGNNFTATPGPKKISACRVRPTHNVQLWRRHYHTNRENSPNPYPTLTRDTIVLGEWPLPCPGLRPDLCRGDMWEDFFNYSLKICYSVSQTRDLGGATRPPQPLAEGLFFQARCEACRR